MSPLFLLILVISNQVLGNHESHKHHHNGSKDEINWNKYIKHSFLYSSSISYIYYAFAGVAVVLWVLGTIKYCRKTQPIGSKSKAMIISSVFSAIFIALCVGISAMCLKMAIRSVKLEHSIHKLNSSIITALHNGDKDFSGFDSLDEISWSLYRSFDSLSYDWQMLPFLNNTGYKLLSRQCANAYNLSLLNTLEVSSPQDSNEKVIPEMIANLGPIAENNTISNTLLNISTYTYSSLLNYTSILISEFSNYNYSAYKQIFVNLNGNFSQIYTIDSITNISKHLSRPLLIVSIVILSIYSFTALVYLIYLFFRSRISVSIQYQLLLIATVVVAFFSGVIAYNSQYYTEFCNILAESEKPNATHARDSFLTILNPLSYKKEYSKYLKSCLFYGEPPLADYLRANIGLDNIIQEVETTQQIANLFLDEYYYQDFYPSYFSFIRNQIFNMEHNPVNLTLPYSKDQLEMLNNLTESNADGCVIHDKWVYSYLNGDCGDYPFLGDPNIGDMACISLENVNETFLSNRYNESFVNSCDPTNSIKQLYMPLLSFIDSVSNAFNNISVKFELYLQNFYYASELIRSVENSVNMILNDSTLTSYLLKEYSTESMGNCSHIKKNMRKIAEKICKCYQIPSRFSKALIILALISMMAGVCRFITGMHMKKSEMRQMKEKEVLIEVTKR